MRRKIFLLYLLLNANCILYLSAQTWNPVGDSTQSINYSLTTHGGTIFVIKQIDSLLYVGGAYYYAGNMKVNSIATWDGTKWDSLGSGIYSACYDVCKFDNQIYLGGGGGFVKFNGNDWMEVGPGLTVNAANSLLIYNNKLYAGGRGFQLNSINMHNVLSWDSINYSGLNGGVTGTFQEVRALAVYDNELIAGGDFSYAGGNLAFNIAAWNGTNWKALDTGTNSRVDALAVDTINNFLYVGGGFNSVGGITSINTQCIVRWNGFQWDSVRGGLPYCDVMALTMYNNKLFTGMCGPFSIGAPAMACWDGKIWKNFDSINGAVYALGTYNDELYVGGAFSKIGQDSIFSIARYYEPPDTTCDYLQAIIEPRNVVLYTSDTTTVHFYNNIAHAISWQWDFGDGVKDSVQLPIHTYLNHGVYNISVIVTYQNCKDTAYTKVFANPCNMMPVTISPANDTFFLSSSATVHFTSSISDADSYYWSFGDGLTSTLKNPVHAYVDDSVYSVMLIIVKGDCIDTTYAAVTIMDDTGIKESTINEINYLGDNIPNPFKNITIIPYYVPQGNKGTLQINDIRGILVKEYVLQQGKKDLEISLSELKVGVYYYTILINGVKKKTLKMVIQ